MVVLVRLAAVRVEHKRQSGPGRADQHTLNLADISEREATMSVPMWVVPLAVLAGYGLCLLHNYIYR